MTSKMKVLGLALLATAAMAAISAQAASAAVNHTFFATSAPLELTGEQTGENVFKAGKVEIKCTTATPEGTISEKTADEISLSFSLGGCKLGGSTPVEVINEGCQLAVDSDTTADPNTGGESAAGSLKCAEGKLLKVVGGGCTTDISSQGPLHGTKFSNTGTSPKEEVTVESHVFGVEYNATSLNCALLGISKGVHKDGTLLINAKVQGYEAGQAHDSAHQVGIGVETP